MNLSFLRVSVCCDVPSGPRGSVFGDAHTPAGASDGRQRGGRHLLPEGVRPQTDRGVPPRNQRYSAATTVKSSYRLLSVSVE